jgi:quercetin dioxygenase-like cupin family protein
MVYLKKGSHKQHYFIDPTKYQTIVQMEGLETTILTGLGDEKMMMVFSAIMPGHSVPLHSHPHEQVGMVYSGKAVLRSGGEERLVKKGEFYRIPSNLPYSDTNVGEEPFIMLDIFYPIREDFVEKLGSSNR